MCPSDVRIDSSLDSFNITWKSGYEQHKYVKPERLSYNISVQKAHGKSRTVRLTHLCFHKSLLNMEVNFTLMYSKCSKSTFL